MKELKRPSSVPLIARHSFAVRAMWYRNSSACITLEDVFSINIVVDEGDLKEKLLSNSIMQNLNSLGENEYPVSEHDLLQVYVTLGHTSFETFMKESTDHIRLRL